MKAFLGESNKSSIHFYSSAKYHTVYAVKLVLYDSSVEVSKGENYDSIIPHIYHIPERDFQYV